MHFSYKIKELKKAFQAYVSAIHKQNAEGGLSVNLTDQEKIGLLLYNHVVENRNLREDTNFDFEGLLEKDDGFRNQLYNYLHEIPEVVSDADTTIVTTHAFTYKSRTYTLKTENLTQRQIDLLNEPGQLTVIHTLDKLEGRIKTRTGADYRIVYLNIER